MGESNHDARPRASLRGKGREILLGERAGASAESAPEEAQRRSQPDQARAEPVDAASLPLTPEEAEALLDFSPTSPAYQAGPPFDLGEPASGTAGGGDDAETNGPPSFAVGDNPPLAGRSAYAPAELDRSWSETDEFVDGEKTALPGESTLARDAGVDGGLIAPEGVAPGAPAARGIADRPSPVPVRQRPVSVLPGSMPPDPDLLDRLVDDERLNKLWNQIDAVQEEIIHMAGGERGRTDMYQQELLQASSMLLESRANYDEARAIVYRIRSDLNRQRKVTADIIRYRPLLLNYYLGWGIAWIVLVALKQLFAGIAEAVGVDVFAALYYPTLFGVAGALISGYVTLDRHTTKLRDFDPIYISWYLFNPLLGGVMGLFMFLLASVANEDLLQDSASTAELAVAWLLCVAAGMNQNSVFGQLNRLLKRREDRES